MLALRQSASLSSLWRRANARNVRLLNLSRKLEINLLALQARTYTACESSDRAIDGTRAKSEDERREIFHPSSLSLRCRYFLVSKRKKAFRCLERGPSFRWTQPDSPGQYSSFIPGQMSKSIFLEKRENWKRLAKSWNFCCHISIPVIANLRKKFEEDKKRIAEMKSARKFRPYWLLFVVCKVVHYVSYCTVSFNVPSIVCCQEAKLWGLGHEFFWGPLCSWLCSQTIRIIQESDKLSW